MRARVYVNVEGVGPGLVGWLTLTVADPPLPTLRMPIMTTRGLEQLSFALVAVEHGTAVYV